MRDIKEIVDEAVDGWLPTLSEVQDVGASDEYNGRGPGYEITRTDVDSLKLRVEVAFRREVMAEADADRAVRTT